MAIATASTALTAAQFRSAASGPRPKAAVKAETATEMATQGRQVKRAR
jgi:hypothetical protein